MKHLWISLITAASALTLTTACSSDDDEEEVIDTTQKTEETAQTDNQRLNEFTYNMLDTYYYWADSLKKNVTTFPDEAPSTWLDELRYSTDLWSYIQEETVVSSKAVSVGDKVLTTGFGFNLAFGSFTNTDGYFAIVNFVYSGTPADKAGIKRGDIILYINGSIITESNYASLYDDSDIEITMGSYSSTEGSISKTDGDPIKLTAESYWGDPVLYSSVIEKGNTKIGYLMYASYESAADGELDEVFSKFKEEGITDLVLDLRYNTGGDVSSVVHLCSMIAPSATVSKGSLLTKNIWNDTYMAWAKSKGISDELNDYFDKTVTTNLNMDHVYILTDYMTASASEMTIIGLMPYMTVTTMGGTTYGKCYGGPVVSPSNYDDSWSDLDSWVLYLIGYKVSNANGYTDYQDGIEPTIAVTTDIETVPIGDESDQLLSAAIAQITGSGVSTKSIRHSNIRYKKEWTNTKDRLKCELYRR